MPHLDIHIRSAISKWEEDFGVSKLDKLLGNSAYDTIDIYLNSPGGSVYEGLAIYNTLKRQKAHKRVFIDGCACSIASIIAMAGDEIIMYKSSIMMIHNAFTYAMGNFKELRKIADDLEIINTSLSEIYMDKTTQDKAVISELMDKETYLNAEKCLSYGFCTRIEEANEQTEKNVQNSLDKSLDLYKIQLNSIQELKNAIKEIQGENVSTMEAENSAKIQVETNKEQTLRKFLGGN